MAGANSERGVNKAGEQVRPPDSFVGIADHRFGRLLGARMTHHFNRRHVIFAEGKDRFVVHLLEDPDDKGGTTAVLQRPQAYLANPAEEFRIGYVPGDPLGERLKPKDKDDFFKELGSIGQNKKAIVAADKLKEQLLAEHPFLADVS